MGSSKIYAVAIIKCPPIGQFMMATAYFFEELISEICSFHRIELRHRDRALLYVRKVSKIGTRNGFVEKGK